MLRESVSIRTTGALAHFSTTSFSSNSIVGLTATGGAVENYDGGDGALRSVHKLIASGIYSFILIWGFTF